MDSVTVAFELIALELNVEVEDLNSEGAQLFRDSNYEAAKSLTEKGKALRDFCNRVSQLSEEWTESFAAETLTPAGIEREHEAARKILSASKGAKTGLMVRFKDGSVICEPKAAMTLANAIQRIGFEKVEALGILVNKENIVSRNPSPKYQDTFVAPYYVKTHSNTEQKKKNLDRISEELGLGLTVTVIS